MSKKKEKKIKKLQHMPVWPAVMEMIFSEILIYIISITVFTFAAVCLMNQIVIQNDKSAKAALNAVNSEWKSGREVFDARINNLIEDFEAIDCIFIVKSADNSVLRTYGNREANAKTRENLKNLLEKQNKERFENEGLIYFLEDSTADFFKLDLGTFAPKKFFQSLQLFKLLKHKNVINWAGREVSSIPVLVCFKTDYTEIKLCVKMRYSVTEFFSSFIFVLGILLGFIIILCGVLGITRVVKFAHEAKRINLLVTTDSVTGGYNKEYFMHKAAKVVRRGKKKYVVVQLRLEKYRNFCITYGLKEGENLLEVINSSVSMLLGRKELIAHVEKSDFVILMQDDGREAVENRIKSIMNLLKAKRRGQHLSFSAGICAIKSSFTDISIMVSYAGLALPKQPKIQNEIVWFNDSMKESQIWERQIEDDMKKALENHEFQVYLQPKYSTKAEELSAAEALVRWTHPKLGFISPAQFIPIFEKNGFILQLDDYMLTEVAKIQSGWIAQGKRLVPISVNVSRAHFAEDNLAEHICSVVDGYNVPHQFIELELTESAFFDDKAVLLNTIKKLKNYGFKVSMDDFGAGYSSLNSLKELPLDIIKLDGEFFRSVEDTVKSKLIVGETITLAKKLGMQIVAEGIETREQVDFLAGLNCDLIQGFYFSKPLPLKEFEKKAYQNQ